jgi:hypothetical protein
MSSYEDVKRWARVGNWGYSDDVLHRVAAVVDRIGRDRLFRTEETGEWYSEAYTLCGGDTDLMDAVISYARQH